MDHNLRSTSMGNSIEEGKIDERSIVRDTDKPRFTTSITHIFIQTKNDN